MPSLVPACIVATAFLLGAADASAQVTAVVSPIVIRSGEVVCNLTGHGGVPDDDARTAADLICGELAEHGAAAEPYEIRLGTLDSSVVVTVTRVNRQSSRRVVLSSLGELPVAAPRLATAITSDKPIADTENADNVIAAEARRPTTKNGTAAAVAELFAATHTGHAPGISGGVGVGLDYRLESVAIGARGRLGGIGDGNDKLGLATLDIGARYFPLDGAIAPYIGGGFVVGYYKASHADGGDAEGSGVGSFAEIGVDWLRNSRIGIYTAVRADIPFFELRGSSDAYVVPLTFNVGIVFR